jgi:Tfp pilus assembly protein PilF
VTVLASLLVLSGACATSPSEKKLLAQQKYDEAQSLGNLKKEKYKKLMEAIRMAPKDPLYRVGLGDEYFKDGHFDKAEKVYLSAISERHQS